MYSEKLLMMDRGIVRDMYSFIPKINLRNYRFIISIYHDSRSPERQNRMRVISFLFLIITPGLFSVTSLSVCSA